MALTPGTVSRMTLAGALHRHSVRLFGAFSALVLWGFWSSYYGNPFAMAPRGSSIGLVHVHALAMTAWCLLLYGLAVLYRRTPALHARFMVSTVCPFLGAATDRITFGYVPVIEPVVSLDGQSMAYVRLMTGGGGELVRVCAPRAVPARGRSPGLAESSQHCRHLRPRRT